MQVGSRFLPSRLKEPEFEVSSIDMMVSGEREIRNECEEELYCDIDVLKLKTAFSQFTNHRSRPVDRDLLQPEKTKSKID